MNTESHSATTPHAEVVGVVSDGRSYVRVLLHAGQFYVPIKEAEFDLGHLAAVAGKPQTVIWFLVEDQRKKRLHPTYEGTLTGAAPLDDVWTLLGNFGSHASSRVSTLHQNLGQWREATAALRAVPTQAATTHDAPSISARIERFNLPGCSADQVAALRKRIERGIAEVIAREYLQLLAANGSVH